MKLTRKEQEEKKKELKLQLEQVDNATIDDENPFDVKDRERAYYLDNRFTISESHSWDSEELKDYIPCKDIKISQELANQAKLNALLTKFAYDSEAVVTEDMWEDKNILKWFVQVDYIKYGKLYKITCVKYYKILSTVYFTSHEVAQRAINEVVIPFMEAHE